MSLRCLIWYLSLNFTMFYLLRQMKRASCKTGWRRKQVWRMSHSGPAATSPFPALWRLFARHGGRRTSLRSWELIFLLSSPLKISCYDDVADWESYITERWMVYVVTLIRYRIPKPASYQNHSLREQPPWYVGRKVWRIKLRINLTAWWIEKNIQLHWDIYVRFDRVKCKRGVST